MEYISYCGNTPTTEDSGLGESSRNESSSISASYTPTTSLTTSRKRKLERQIFKSIGARQHTPNIDSVESSPWVKNPEILSSTLNDSITTGVENCKLESYTTTNDTTTDTSSFMRNVKEPATPEKRSKSNHNSYYNAVSSPRLSPLHKLGSPERNEIIYPNLPNLARLSESKRCSPAKKRLFVPRRKDPVALFCREKSVNHLMTKVFLFLSERDLYSCSKVSKGWRREIMANSKLKNKLQTFEINQIMNKENNFDSPVFGVGTIGGYCDTIKQSTPMQPKSIYEITDSLTNTQYVEKCFCCNRPEAVVDKNISQCKNWRCGAIRCLKCNSISIRGPEKFHDECQQASLLIDKPPPRHSLLSSPKHYQNADGIPTFLLDDSANLSSQTFNSSGYLTESELSNGSHRHSVSFGHVLKPCNVNVENQQSSRCWMRRNSVCPVVSLEKREEIIEPSSPPKVKPHVAGTKKSKKMLKRLIL